jgi:predicted ATPase
MNGENPFVARQPELAQLDSFLDQALSGQGQVCFIAGEAGSGKTTLLDEFAHRAQAEYRDLVVATGCCDAQTGVGDAYLPFREVLNLLTGDVEGQLAQGAISEENAARLRRIVKTAGSCLLDYGPDLIGIFVPGASLAAQLVSMGFSLSAKTGLLDRLRQGARAPGVGPVDKEIEQSHIFEQYTNVLKRLAEQTPLLLILDDLQWADGASLGLLFRLGRRVRDSRLLVLGTYRPNDVALGRGGERHPLVPVLTEMKRYSGEMVVDLDQARGERGRAFVDAYLDTEPNRLGRAFREALFQHTGGHALFTVELLREMQDRGDLVQDEEGYWVEGPVLDWSALPLRVEGVIEERIGRVSDELRETLTVASVEGQAFTAEVLARVQSMEVRGLVRQLSGELHKRHRLVESEGVARLGRQRISRYRFSHHLMQAYLYGNLDQVEVSFLHEDVGKALEALHGEQADEIAVQLARHFVLAELPDRASYYLQRAGESAAAGYAHEEAVDYFSQALALIPEEDIEARYDLLLEREAVYYLQGEREAGAQDLATLGTLAQELDDVGRQIKVALRQARYSEVIGNYPGAIVAAQTAIEIAQSLRDENSEAEGYLAWGRALYRQGDNEHARTYLQQSLALAQATGDQQIQAEALRNLGVVAWGMSQYEQAARYLQQSLAIAQELGNRGIESAALGNLGIVAYFQVQYERAIGHYEQSLAIFREIGDRMGEGAVLNNLGNIATVQRLYGQASRYYEQSLAIAQETGERAGEIMALGNLGYVILNLGQYDRACHYFEKSLAISQEIGDRTREGVALCNLGYVASNLGQHERASRYFEQSLAISQEIGDRSAEGFALTGLGDALVSSGQWSQAEATLRAAITLRQDLGHSALLMESQTTLARLYLARAQPEQALAALADVLVYLEGGGSIDGTEYGLRNYLICYQVLRACGDSRAAGALQTAYDTLQEQAARIPDDIIIEGESTRHSFLERIPWHRDIVAAWQTIESPQEGTARENGQA